ncbi:hypothetical protein HNP77_002262 [Treponema rectale]|uniref:Uncharacterized protein n=1 Tax=Treponema rectale TaxID=744512 RepID=A0A840SK78_9SPIR|nr:hypothetical protein [Treponema rectale]MBB5219873.1 hypothetical protein [Treponema rectale]
MNGTIPKICAAADRKRPVKVSILYFPAKFISCARGDFFFLLVDSDEPADSFVLSKLTEEDIYYSLVSVN